MSKRVRKLDHLAEQLDAGYRNGFSLEELAKLHNVSKGSVRLTLKDFGTPLRKRGRPASKPVKGDE